MSDRGNVCHVFRISENQNIVKRVNIGDNLAGITQYEMEMWTGKVQPELLICDRSELVGGRRKECRRGLSDGGGRSFFLERGEGFESISLYGRDGETLGVCVTDREVSLCADDVVAATYDRISGALKSASLSLPRALIEAQERGLAVDEELFSWAWGLLADGGDLTVVVRFDGVDERIALIRTNGVVNCPEGLAFPADMAEGYEEDGGGRSGRSGL